MILYRLDTAFQWTGAMRIFSISLLSVLISFGVLAAEVQDVNSRGETTRLLVEQGGNPWVTVVLFAGGKGVMNISESGSIGWGRGNFLVRSRYYFQNFGAITAVIDAPTDRRYGLHGFRSTEDQAKDVGAVIKHLREEYGLPVWLIGTSRGTNSAANAALRLKSDKPDGIVLTASMLAYNPKWGGDYLLTMDLEKIKMPVLIAHHKKDACSVTPPGLVGELKEKLINAEPVEVMWYESGSGVKGKVCQARHYHGFAGIEEEVVSDIMSWIKSQTP
ncbi:MAG: alpha/beta hydrolase [Gammaproteobacteria bacterium]|nr:alpha/beta hydrolase [Gammaproteobacteria bacterium]